MSYRDLDLSDDYDALLSTSQELSAEFLRIIRNAVYAAFERSNSKPEKEYCDADVDDVCQDVLLKVLSPALKECRVVANKSALLIGLSSMWAGSACQSTTDGAA